MNHFIKVLLAAAIVCCTLFTTKAQLAINTLAVPVPVDFTGFDASGFTPTPTAGQLDSDTWSARGFSDGDLFFGGTEVSGDFARGASTGSVTTGGIYAFDHGGGNVMLGVQPTGTDFTPGEFILRLQNLTGSAINQLDVSYLVWELNNADRGNTFNFSHTSDTILGFFNEPALDHTTPATADIPPAWDSIPKSISLLGINFPDNGFYYLRWYSDDFNGAGSRDEFGVDSIILVALDCTPPAPVPSNTDTFCQGDTVLGVSSSGSNVTWYNDSLHTDTINLGAALIYGIATTTDTVWVTQNPSGCESPAVMVVITVMPAPVVDFSFSVAGLTVNFTDNTSGGTPPYSYFWDFGDVTTSTTQNPGHTYASTGGYLVQLTVTDTNGCIDVFSDSVFLALGIAETMALNSLMVYPNPTTNGFVTIDFGENYCASTTLTVYDLIGNIMYQEKLGKFPLNKHLINLSALAEGNYFISIVNEAGVISKRITIRK